MCQQASEGLNPSNGIRPGLSVYLKLNLAKKDTLITVTLSFTLPSQMPCTHILPDGTGTEELLHNVKLAPADAQLQAREAVFACLLSF